MAAEVALEDRVLAVLAALLEHIRAHDGVWFATHAEVARWCLAQAAGLGPAGGRGRPAR